MSLVAFLGMATEQYWMISRALRFQWVLPDVRTGKSMSLTVPRTLRTPGYLQSVVID